MSKHIIVVDTEHRIRRGYFNDIRENEYISEVELANIYLSVSKKDINLSSPMGKLEFLMDVLGEKQIDEMLEEKMQENEFTIKHFVLDYLVPVEEREKEERELERKAMAYDRPSEVIHRAMLSGVKTASEFNEFLKA